MYDICIIGGGAAGLSCAITAGRLGLKVLLVEKNNKLGKKLYATGNGRCNITNYNFNIANNYNSSYDYYESFLYKAFNNAYNSKEANIQILDFFESLGVYTVNDNNYIYPQSNQASSVVWSMIDEVNNYNIKILLNEEIISIAGKYPHFIIKSANQAYTASQVVLANGGEAYKSLGGTDSGYNLAKSNGHSVTNIMPCLCGLITEEDTMDIAGVRSKATIKLFNSSGNFIATSCGELQFTQQGLSGICIFELSSKIGKLLAAGERPELSISLLDTIEAPHTYDSIISRIKNKLIGNRSLIGLLNGYVNDKIANYVCKINNINGKTKAIDIDKQQLIDIVSNLNNIRYHVKGLNNMDQAQVTAGGVNLDEIDPNTMESKYVDGLYIVGELLDIDGICGGYNLTFAILSGIKAGKSIYDKNQSN